jgi:imidazolonepropionase
MRKLFRNIHQLYTVSAHSRLFKAGKEMQDAGLISNAWMSIQDGNIEGVGGMDTCPSASEFQEVVECKNRIVFPGYCDSHTHIIFAATREGEFVDKIRGLSYEEIAKRGGGILNSAARLRATTEDELFDTALARAKEMIGSGTTAFEVKSGYGLSTKDELKMLKVAARLKSSLPVTIKSTFLGAHAVPPEYKGHQAGYVDLIVQEMLPAIAAEGLADFVDVFCDEGFFTPDESSRILEAAAKYGLKPKIHANELAVSGGVQVGVRHQALSVDHLERITEVEVEALKHSSTMPVALPGTSFFLRIPYTPGRMILEAGLPLALASDFNPGSSPSGNMNLIFSLACIQMRLLPEEALAALTLNGAYAMGISDREGNLESGKLANFIVTRPLSELAVVPYYYGFSVIDKVVVKGVVIN